MCPACRSRTSEDALAAQNLEIVATVHDACAPVTHYTCRCRICETHWAVIEVFDERGHHASEWSWTRVDAPT
jgi:hypothetical protein